MKRKLLTILPIVNTEFLLQFLVRFLRKIRHKQVPLKKKQRQSMSQNYSQKQCILYTYGATRSA